MSDLLIALVSVLVGSGLTVVGAFANARIQRRFELDREQRSVIDRYLEAGVAAHEALNRIVFAFEHKRTDELNEHLAGLSVADSSFRSAALALVTRSAETDVLSSQAIEAANLYSDVLSNVRGAVSAPIDLDRVVYERTSRQKGAEFVRRFSSSFQTVQMARDAAASRRLPLRARRRLQDGPSAAQQTSEP